MNRFYSVILAISRQFFFALCVYFFRVHCAKKSLSKHLRCLISISESLFSNRLLLRGLSRFLSFLRRAVGKQVKTDIFICHCIPTVSELYPECIQSGSKVYPGSIRRLSKDILKEMKKLDCGFTNIFLQTRFQFLFFIPKFLFQISYS